MGLDMYLYAVKVEYKSKYYSCPKNTMLTLDYPAPLDFVKNFCDPSVSVRHSYKIAYWRKANAIHKYFVDLYDSVDDCRPIEVDFADLENLVKLCEEVLNDHSKAEELLPTQDGFFFGDTEYNKWYFEDIDLTIQMLKPAIKAIKELRKNGEEWYIEYQASW